MPDLTPPATPPGLSQTEADSRLRADGPNALPRAAPRTTWRIALEVAREPMFQLLAAAVGIYLLLGERSEALVLLAFLAVIVGITLVQERRTERVLEALHDMTSPRALAWRDGERQRIAGTELVCGDVIELAEGDRVPADARLLQANDLRVDESLISGESVPVGKQAGSGEAGTVFAGTLVVAGQARAEVTATGARSHIGLIGKVLGTLPTEATPLHRQTRRMVRWFSVLGLVVSLVVGVLYAWALGDWLGAALAGITMAMAMLPQEFLLILTVFMAMGAFRLSRHRVLTRRSATIEALGSATVLCTDKTGTLTHNRMAIAALVRLDGELPQRWDATTTHLPDAWHPLLHHGILASENDPFDPMERAFHALGAQHLPALPTNLTLVHEYGLSADCPAMTHVWHTPGAAHTTVAIKGAPETVARLCRLPPAQAEAWLGQAQALAAQGHRVLGVAHATWGNGQWPATPEGFDFQPLGLVALADPLRDNVPQAVRDCQQAGIRVVMITGDHPVTAQAIAAQAGIHGTEGLLLGAQVAALDDMALRQAVAHTAVFARVAPQQKLRIVQALKANGEVVAMTGDGVNDAPSLRAAHIGIAMGGRGTDVARESASLVLLDDDFGTLVQAIRLGRRIFDNLSKAMRFVLAVHVPIAGLTLVPLVLGWPLLFTPMHIAFLEIVIDPVGSIVFEAEEAESDVMSRPPRAPDAPLFSPALIVTSLLQGALVLLLVGGFYGSLLGQSVPAEAARAAAFTALVLANIALVLVNRSLHARWRVALGSHNRALLVTVLLTLAMLALVLGVPALRTLFGFAMPDTLTLLGALGVGVGALLPLWGLRSATQRWATPRGG